MKRRFHISCCGRSGSKYIAAALRNMGFSAIHEMGDDWPIPSELGVKYFAQHPKQFAMFDGIVGWKWSILTPRYAESFPVQIHMVRHPISAIESATTHADSLFTSVEKHLGSTDFVNPDAAPNILRLARATNYWIKYNKKFSVGKPVIKVEEFREDGDGVITFCDLIGAKTECQALISSMPKDINSRPKATRRVKTSWELLDEHFPKQADEIRKMAIDFGYDAEVASGS